MKPHAAVFIQTHLRAEVKFQCWGCGLGGSPLWVTNRTGELLPPESGEPNDVGGFSFGAACLGVWRSNQTTHGGKHDRSLVERSNTKRPHALTRSPPARLTRAVGPWVLDPKLAVPENVAAARRVDADDDIDGRVGVERDARVDRAHPLGVLQRHEPRDAALGRGRRIDLTAREEEEEEEGGSVAPPCALMVVPT